MKKLITASILLLLAACVFAQAPHKYGIKCGIVKTVTDNAGRKSYNTLWFDDYGAKEKTMTKMDMGGGMGDAEWVSISIGDKTYMLDAARKTATANKRLDINYLDMPEDMVKARKAKVIGEETINGRKCVKWEEHIKQILHTATLVSWVWKGIPIQYTIDKPKSTTTLISIEQPKSLSSSIFTIPADYTQKNL